MAQLTPSDHRKLLELEADRLRKVQASELDLDIPHLDGWTVRSVVGHTGWVLRFAALSLQAEPEDRPTRSSVPEPPPGPDVISWLVESYEELASVLDAVDLASARPTFTGPQPASWWFRRLGHELAMHRWDVESASTSPEPIDSRQALDGIDEVLEVFVPHRLHFPVLEGNGETVHLHATDIDDGEWLMTYQAESIAWERAHAKGDVAARGPVADLLLMLWGRIPPARLELFGDASLLDRWQEAATF